MDENDDADLKVPGYGLKSKIPTIAVLCAVIACIAVIVWISFRPTEKNGEKQLSALQADTGVPADATAEEVAQTTPAPDPVDAGSIDAQTTVAVVTKSRCVTFDPATLVPVARKYLNVPYRWSGRGTKQLPNLDCLGLVYKAIEDLCGIPWRHWSVMPSKLLKQLKGRQILIPLFGEESTIKSAIRKLEPGDIIFLLWAEIPNSDIAVKHIEIPDENGNKSKAGLWVWHTGIYSGNGKFIHTAPYAGHATEEDLFDFSIPLKFNAVLGVRVGSL